MTYKTLGTQNETQVKQIDSYCHASVQNYFFVKNISTISTKRYS